MLKKVIKYFSFNALWILMFIPLWPVEDLHLFRLSLSLLAAGTLAVFQVLFVLRGLIPSARSRVRASGRLKKY
jgi:hypothetical protein